MSRRYSPYVARQRREARRNTLAGCGLLALSAAAMALPFAWAYFAPASFVRYVWGI